MPHDSDAPTLGKRKAGPEASSSWPDFRIVGDFQESRFSSWEGKESVLPGRGQSRRCLLSKRVGWKGRGVRGGSAWCPSTAGAPLLLLAPPCSWVGTTVLRMQEASSPDLAPRWGGQLRTSCLPVWDRPKQKIPFLCQTTENLGLFLAVASLSLLAMKGDW